MLINDHLLVGSTYPSEKDQFVSRDEMKFPTEWKKKTCSKLPIRYIMVYPIYYIPYNHPIIMNIPVTTNQIIVAYLILPGDHDMWNWDMYDIY